MAASAPKDSAQFKPVAGAAARRQLLAGVFLVLIGVLAVPIGLVGVALPLLVGGLFLSAISVYVRRVGEGAQLINRANDTVDRGRLAEAEALLVQAGARTRAGYVHRVIDLQRATIALRRGDLQVALKHADASLSRPLGMMGRAQAKLNVAGGHALRALLRAATGDEKGAGEDVDFVRASPEGGPEVLARAELAVAVRLERSGDHEALRAHLTGARRLLLEHTQPRERAIVRAYQRMLEARRASVYREGAPREPQRAGADEPTVADWMAEVVPAAAPFARAAARPVKDAQAAPEPAEVIDPEARREAQARLKPRSGLRLVGLVLALWAALVAVFLGLWTFLASGTQGPSAEPVESSPTLGMLPLLVIVFVGVFGVLVAARRHADHQALRLLAALRAIVAGEEARGEEELRVLTKSRYPLVSGRAWQELALLAERRAAFQVALDACDHAVKALSRTPGARAMASYLLLPEVIGERAFLLAATGRDAQAGAEMALLQETYPAHPYRARAELRVGLLRRIRRGDLAGAAALAATGTEDIPLGLRDETLASVVRAAVHPESAGAGEIERLKRELRGDPDLCAWLEAVAPTAMSAFTAAEHRRGDGADADVDAEREALAEQEAAEHETPAREEIGASSS